MEGDHGTGDRIWRLFMLVLAEGERWRVNVQTLRDQGAGIEGEADGGYVLRPGFLRPPL